MSLNGLATLSMMDSVDLCGGMRWGKYLICDSLSGGNLSGAVTWDIIKRDGIVTLKSTLAQHMAMIITTI